MGWLDKLKAAGLEAQRMTREAAAAVVEEAETEFGDHEWYGSAKRLGRTVGEFGLDVVAVTRETATEAVETVGQTEAGRYAGRTSRQVAGFLSKLPLLSVATDIMRARNGIDGLYEHLKASPDDPVRNLWLAEAMARLERDRGRYIAIRTAIDPSFYVRQRAMEVGVGVGAEKQRPPRERLLRNAFALAIRRLEQDPADAAALHVLSRVYLGQEVLGEAVRFSKLSILADSGDGHSVFTLGRCYLALDQPDNSRRAALLAIERGTSMGNELLAELCLVDPALAGTDRIEAYSESLERVEVDDRARYSGPAVRSVDVFDAVRAAQLQKARDLLDRI